VTQYVVTSELTSLLNCSLLEVHS